MKPKSEMEETTMDKMLKPFNERMKNPFIASFIISWIIVNWKAIFYMIYSDESVKERFENSQGYTHWYTLILIPILSAVFFTFAMPYINLFIGWVNLNATRKKRRSIKENRKEEMQDEKEIQIENLKIEEAKTEYLERKRKNDEITNLTSKNIELNEEINRLNSEVNKREDKISTLSKEKNENYRVNRNIEKQLQTEKKKLATEQLQEVQELNTILLSTQTELNEMKSENNVLKSNLNNIRSSTHIISRRSLENNMIMRYIDDSNREIIFQKLDDQEVYRDAETGTLIDINNVQRFMKREEIIPVNPYYEK